MAKRPSLESTGLFRDTRGAEPQAEAPAPAMPAEALEELRHNTGRGRPKTNFREITKSSQAGLPVGWDRRTFILSEENIDRIEWYAYRSRRKIKVAVNEILDSFFKGHPVEPVPEEEIRSWKGK
jgi:hypothetical protein